MSPLKNGRTLKMSLPTREITTDASLTGWGAQMEQQSIQGLCSDTDKLNHINYLELKTVLFALQHWKHQLRNQVVSLQLDNTTAVSYLLKEGGHSIQIATLPSGGNIDVSRSTGHIGTTKLPTRSNESSGRGSVAIEEGRQMDACPGGSTEDFLDLRPTSSRSICVRKKQAATLLLLNRSERPPLPGDGRSSPELGFSEQVAIRIPSPQIDSIGDRENSSSQATDDNDNTMVAEGSMATRIDRIIGLIVLPVTGVAGHDIELNDQQRPVRLPQVEHDGMAHLRSSLRDGGVEPAVAGFIQNEWKPSTRVQYAAIWRQWTAWCSREGLDAVTPSAVNLLHFLWYLYNDRHLAWRAWVHRSAVATLLQPYAPETISEV